MKGMNKIITLKSLREEGGIHFLQGVPEGDTEARLWKISNILAFLMAGKCQF